MLSGRPKNLPVIGGISIPEVSMNLPIYSLDNVGLYYGAGTMKRRRSTNGTKGITP